MVSFLRAYPLAPAHKRGNYTTGAHPREILARHRENEAGAFRAAGTRARERLSLPRRETSNNQFEGSGDRDGDRCTRGAVSGRLRDRRSWGEADGRGCGSAESPGAYTDPRLEAASPGSRPRWPKPWRGNFPVAESAPCSTSCIRPSHGKRRGDPTKRGALALAQSRDE